MVEVQLGYDNRKRQSWPAYVANLYARHGCPVYLLVICVNPGIANWCATLPAAARDYLEDLMAISTPYQYQSDFARRYFGQGKAEGKAEGEAKAVLAVLDARGLVVPDKVRHVITACTDLDQLDRWIRRAVTASTVSDLFDQA